MIWNIQYRTGTEDLTDEHSTPELAIEAACGLMDAGYEVFSIGTGLSADSIGRDEIIRIHALWKERAGIGRTFRPKERPRSRHTDIAGADQNPLMALDAPKELN